MFLQERFHYSYLFMKIWLAVSTQKVLIASAKWNIDILKQDEECMSRLTTVLCLYSHFPPCCPGDPGLCLITVIQDDCWSLRGAGGVPGDLQCCPRLLPGGEWGYRGLADRAGAAGQEHHLGFSDASAHHGINSPQPAVFESGCCPHAIPGDTQLVEQSGALFACYMCICSLWALTWVILFVDKNSVIVSLYTPGYCSVY